MADNPAETTDFYEHTPNYQLPLYTDETNGDLRDGYNRAMRMIDQLLHQLDIQTRENK